MELNPRVRTILRIGFYISIAIMAFLCVFYIMLLLAYGALSAVGQTGGIAAVRRAGTRRSDRRRQQGAAGDLGGSTGV